MLVGMTGIAGHQGIVLTPISLVGEDDSASASGTVTWPAGTAAGDFAILRAHYSITWTGASTITVPSGEYTDGLLAYKILTASDISSPPSWSGANGNAQWAVYTNTPNITLKGSGETSGTSHTVTGFTKASDSRGVIVAMADRDQGSDTRSITGGTFTEDQDFGASFFGGAFFHAEAADYSGANIVCTGASSYTFAAVFEAYG